MGNQCCGPDPTLMQQYANTEHIKLTKYPTHPSTQTSSLNTISCPLCKSIRQDTLFINHIDTCHYAKLILHKPTPQHQHQHPHKYSLDNIKQLQCILCGYRCNTFNQHQQHINNKHEYLNKLVARNIQLQNKGAKLQSNWSIKDRILPISKLDYYVDSTGISAEIGGQLFDVEYHKAEYVISSTNGNGSIVYNKQQAQSDLVWRYVYETDEQANFYNIQAVEKDGKVIVQSRIFIKKQVTL